MFSLIFIFFPQSFNMRVSFGIVKEVRKILSGHGGEEFNGKELKHSEQGNMNNRTESVK